jgi:hypothetical protein
MIVFSATDVPQSDIPSTVYRVDTREPLTDIFLNGMTSLGSNDDVLSHVKGDSCYYDKQTSAFISTTADENQAREHMKKLWGNSKYKDVTEMYVYEIQPSENFYSAWHTLKYMADLAKLADPELEAANNVYEKYANAWRPMKEWIAKESISNSQIKKVTKYKKKLGTVREMVMEMSAENPHYSIDLDTPPTASSQPYKTTQTQNDAPEGNTVRALVTFGRHLFSACTLACTRRSPNTPPTPNSRKDTISEDNGCITPVTVILDLAEEELEVWDLVLNDVIEKLVPWRQTVKDEDHHKITHPTECTVDVGEENEHKLKVRCNHEHNLYSKFFVSLYAHRSSAWYNLWAPWSERVKQKYEVNVGHDWEIEDTEIKSEGRYGIMFPLNDGHSRRFTVAGVFRTGDEWETTTIRVLPIYPE